MQESFLHFIWQFQYFRKEALRTVANEPLVILHPGQLNSDAGPDFSQSKIQIGSLEWHGHTEIHVKASDWHQHRHEVDPAYQHVVLHVVWENDVNILGVDGLPIPSLELKDRVDPSLMEEYRQLVENLNIIPCAQLIRHASDMSVLTMLERVMMQRLEEKAMLVDETLERNNQDWEETAYQLLARNFGFKINAEAFMSLSRGLSYKIVAKHRQDLLQLEALLFGQSGLLGVAPAGEAYVNALKKEHRFLSHKYQLASTKVAPEQWKFLRLRPANFPTIRIAQFAALLHQHGNLFSLFKSIEHMADLQSAFQVRQSAYWQEHFHFAKKSKSATPQFGKASLENIVINTLIPLWVAYGKYTDNEKYIDRAIFFLGQLPAEDNKIIRLWQDLGIQFQSAFDSQASIELFNHYCREKRCLSCNIGVSILKRSNMA